MELTKIGRELKCKNVRRGNNIPAEDGNSSAWLWQQINIERKVPWTPHGLFSFLQKNWLFLAVGKTIQKISKLSDLLLWQSWEAKLQLRVQSLEKLKEALWSPTFQGSKICIYKKIKIRNGRRKISECSNRTITLLEKEWGVSPLSKLQTCIQIKYIYKSEKETLCFYFTK